MGCGAGAAGEACERICGGLCGWGWWYTGKLSFGGSVWTKRLSFLGPQCFTIATMNPHNNLKCMKALVI